MESLRAPASNACLEYTLSPQQFQKFRALIHATTGIALGPEKTELVRGRLSRRLRALHLDSFDDYYTLVKRGDPAEIEQFTNAVTTNLTSFFREPAHFDILRERVVARAVAAAESGGRRQLRVWCAAASTGEEPYTIALTLLDGLRDPSLWDVRVLATDIDTSVLERAERGVYPDEALDQIPAAQHKWFIRGTGDKKGFIRARKELRSVIAFRQMNLLANPWPVRIAFDAVFCRNVLIYFDSETQRSTVARLCGHLAPEATLFLAHAESMLGMRMGLKQCGDGTFIRTDPV